MVTILVVELSARNDVAFPSLRWLATHMGCSISSVRLAIREAEECGLIRRGERFDSRSFSGGRQTSNVYEIVLHPGMELPEELTQHEERELVIVDDESDPNQLELSVEPREHHRPASVPAVEAPPLPVPPRKQPNSTGPLPAEKRAPLSHLAGPPSQVQQGIKEQREDLEEKTNSTRARGRSQTAPVPTAAAFADQVLPPEKALAWKRRYGHQAFGSLLFALRRNACTEHPELAKRALARLEAASSVQNPGGYFVRVFQAELAALELAGPLSVEDHAAELQRNQQAAILQRLQALNSKIERVPDDIETLQRLYAEREQAQTELRRLAQQTSPLRAEVPVGSPPTPEAHTPTDSKPLPAPALDAVADSEGSLGQNEQNVGNPDDDLVAAFGELRASLGRALPVEQPLAPKLPPGIREAVGHVVGSVAHVDRFIADALKGLGKTSPQMPTKPAPTAVLTQEQLELNRRRQREALRAIREREAQALQPVPHETHAEAEREAASQRILLGFPLPSLAKVEPARDESTCKTASTLESSAA